MLFFTVSRPPTILALQVGRVPHEEGNGPGPGLVVGGTGPGGLDEAGGGTANDRKKPYIIKKLLIFQLLIINFKTIFLENGAGSLV